jgi:threonine dehydrogenase-like Zn-dependent dehydrogenase
LQAEAAENAEIKPGSTVAIWLRPLSASSASPAPQAAQCRPNFLPLTRFESRLDMARDQGAEVINFNEEDPIETFKEFTGKIGVDRVIDAVGVDAMRPHSGPVAQRSEKEHPKESHQIATKKIRVREIGNQETHHPRYSPGVESVAKAGTVSINGVYSDDSKTFPIGVAMNKNLISGSRVG